MAPRCTNSPGNPGRRTPHRARASCLKARAPALRTHLPARRGDHLAAKDHPGQLVARGAVLLGDVEALDLLQVAGHAQPASGGKGRGRTERAARVGW